MPALMTGEAYIEHISNILCLFYVHLFQVLKKRERDYEAERDLLKITNNRIKQRLCVLKKEIVIKQELVKKSQQNGVISMSSQPPADHVPTVNLQGIEGQASPVSVATQTSFTSGEESDTDLAGVSTANMTKAENQQVVTVSIGMEDHSVAVKKEVLMDDEDEDVDVEGEITDDNIEDVDALIKNEVRKNSTEDKAEEARTTPGSSNKRKAVSDDNDNKVEAKKSNIQCCARISC